MGEHPQRKREMQLEANLMYDALKTFNRVNPNKGVLDLMVKESDYLGGAITLNSFDLTLADGSVTPVDFVPAVTRPDLPYTVTNVIFSVETAGVPNSGYWGSQGVEALPNGFQFFFRSCGHDVLAGAVRVTKNSDFATLMHDVQVLTTGSGPSVITARWCFDMCGGGVYIDPNNDSFFKIRINDDMSGRGVNKFYVVLCGMYDDRPINDRTLIRP